MPVGSDRAFCWGGDGVTWEKVEEDLRGDLEY